MNTLRKSALAAFLVLPPASALAQDVSIPVIVVSPTEIPTAESKVASSVTVLTQQDIEKFQRRTIPDLLQLVPGVNVVQTGSPGGLTAIFIRGTNSNHTKVLIDGIEVSDPSSPNRAFDFGPLTTFDLERVEVLRGPQSGLYGSDAIGGVISITTKAGKGPPKATGVVEGGSFGTFNKAASVSGSTDKTSYAFNASQVQVGSVPVTPLEYLLPGQQRNNDAYTNLTLSSKVAHDFSDVFSLKSVARYRDASLLFTQDDNFDFVNNKGAPNDFQSRSNSKQFDGLTEGAFRFLDGRFVNRVGVTYTDIARHTFNPGGVFAAPGYSDFHGQRVKSYWRGEFAIAPGHTLLTGVERQDERGVINQFGSASGKTGNLGSYAELQSEFADRFFIAANVRHDQNDQFGGHNTFRLAPAILIPETGTKLKATYGTGFAAPSINQLFGPFGANLGLLPEESKGYDYGFEQGVWNNRIRFGATAYKNDITNLIENTPIFPFRYENIQRARTQGYEAFVAASFTERVSVRGDYTLTHAKDAITDTDLRRRPVHKWSLRGEWRPIDGLTLTATSIWVSSWRDVNRYTFAIQTAPGYHIVNLAANYDINPNVTVFARADNVFDKRYENPLGWEKTGLGVFGGIRLTTN